MNFLSLLRPAEQLIVDPKEEHRRTFVLLHGRGDRADSFGAGLLNTYFGNDGTLRSSFPNAKFVFLQAPLCELAAAPDTKYHQWFDVWSLAPGSEESDLQIPGLRETVSLVHGTLRQEINLVGAKNVVLGGLSQGCASSLISLLLWEGEPFAACVGMSGWLPFRKALEDALHSEQTQDSGEATGLRAGYASIVDLAERLGHTTSSLPALVYQKIPIFLGHGEADNVVVTQLGREAAACLGSLQATVTFKAYDELAHWYSPEMLEDVVAFLQAEIEKPGV